MSTPDERPETPDEPLPNDNGPGDPGPNAGVTDASAAEVDPAEVDAPADTPDAGPADNDAVEGKPAEADSVDGDPVPDPDRLAEPEVGEPAGTSGEERDSVDLAGSSEDGVAVTEPVASEGPDGTTGSDAVTEPVASEGPDGTTGSDDVVSEEVVSEGPDGTTGSDDVVSEEVRSDDAEIGAGDLDDDLDDEPADDGDEDDDPLVAGTVGAPVRAQDHDDATSTSRRGVIVVGVVLVALVAALVGVFVLNSASDPVYTVYEQSVSRDDLATRLEGLVSEPTVEAARNIEDATSEQRAELASVVSTLITEDAMRIAATDLDVEITEADVDAQLEEVIASGFQGDQAQFEAAVEQSGQTTETVRAQFRTALYAEALVADTGTAVTDEEIQAFYDENFDAPLVAHILTETEDEAAAALQRINDGEDFATVAQEVSLDGSAAQGGRLGPLAPGQFVPPFEEAAMALEPGEFSDPVETEFGWHIITLEPAPTLEEVSGEISTQIEDNRLNEAFVSLAERLDTEAEITVDPAFGTWSGLGGGGLVPAGLDVQEEPALPPQPSE